MSVPEPVDRHPSPFVQFARQRAGTVALVLGVAGLDGVLAAWLALPLDRTAFNLDAPVWAFLVVWAAAAGYLVYARTGGDAVGLGLYLAAALVVAKPLVALSSAAGSGVTTATAASTVGTLFVWELVAVTVGLAALVAGRLLRARADRVHRRRVRRAARRERRRREGGVGTGDGGDRSGRGTVPERNR